MVASILHWFSSFFQNLVSGVLSFISNLLGYLVNGLITVLKFLFKPILIVVALLFYFIAKLATLCVLLFSVLLSIGKLLYSFVMGLFRTLAGFTWTPSTPSHGKWSGAIGQVFAALEPYQLNKIAYVLLFVIWVTTAWAAIRILSSRS